jgi:hypothetical protein
LHNVSVLYEGNGELRVVYRPSTDNADPHYYLPCPHCLGYYGKKEMWKHARRCQFNATPEVRSGRGIREARRLLPRPEGASQLFHEVTVALTNDEVSRVAKTDQLIRGLGEQLCAQHGHDRSKHGFLDLKHTRLA